MRLVIATRETTALWRAYNLYSLFVERALALINPRGHRWPAHAFRHLRRPHGRSSSARSPRQAASVGFTTSRTAGPTTRMPNTTKWFLDVDTRFKFCALIAGGTQRRFERTQCGFFLRGKVDLEEGSDRVFSLTPRDFAHINPNTGTAPIVRNRQEAAMITRIYRKHPVLVDRSSGEERKLWPVRFVQGLFNMTTDSGCSRPPSSLRQRAPTARPPTATGAAMPSGRPSTRAA